MKTVYGNLLWYYQIKDLTKFSHDNKDWQGVLLLNSERRHLDCTPHYHEFIINDNKENAVCPLSINKVAGFDIVNFIKSLADSWPGDYRAFNYWDGGDGGDRGIIICFCLEKPIRNQESLLRVIGQKIDKWHETRKVKYHIETTPAWGCSNYTGPDYHPLSEKQIMDLIKVVQFADNQTLASIWRRIVQGIPGMYLPYPDEGPIDEKIKKVGNPFVRILEEIRRCDNLPDPKYAQEIFDLLNS